MALERDWSQPGEDQDELDAVSIFDNGEPLVDFLAYYPKVRFSMQNPVFEFPRVHLLRRSVATMLGKAADALPAGLYLSVVESYRPMAVQKAMFAHALTEARKRYPDWDEVKILIEAGRFSAPPDAITPPPHITGGAVDLEIVNNDGESIDFSSPFDLLDMRAAPFDAPGLSVVARQNRELLRSVVEPTGLTNYVDEWWHWSYGDNGWALRVGAPHAIYNRIELPDDAHWVGDMSKMPQHAD